MGFKKYRKTELSEMRPIVDDDISQYKMNGRCSGYPFDELSVSAEDAAGGSPKIGDMIARNPKNSSDVWLVSEAYFSDNYEEA